MVKVRINTYTGVNRRAGWNEKVIELEGGNVEDVLRCATMSDGSSLFDLVTNENGVKGDYVVFLNGLNVGILQGLKTEIQDKAYMAVMDVITMPMGG
jgi:hypothetical protein